MQRQIRQMDQHRTRLRFGQHGHPGARADGVECENPPEAGKPLPFDALLQHRVLPIDVSLFLRFSLLVS
ncbi:hypothetical protein ACHMW4_06655 [Mesorhizobium sp. UC22_110]|uniref:hypothetical protein n=1 Tax=Mesorhizobium sp. UC22_110 TaxID=3374552 RepID=UPI003756D4B4